MASDSEPTKIELDDINTTRSTTTTTGLINKSYLPENDLNPSESYFLGRADACNPPSCAEQDQDVKSRCVRCVRMTEVVPSSSQIYGANSSEENITKEPDWKMSVNQFSSKKQGDKGDKAWTKRIRSYYKAQDGLIETYENIEDLERKTAEERNADPEEKKSYAAFFAKLSLAANLILLIAKLAAAILSGSISVISSLVDSIVDFASGIVIWATTRAVKNRNLYEYPQGRTKLEPIAIVVLSVVMSVASLQLIRESAEKIVDLANYNSTAPSFTIPTIVITASTVVIKLVLYLLCRRVQKPSVQALAQDHRNDVLSNSVALVCGYLGSKEMQNNVPGAYGLVYIDPCGAIVISIYIIISWWITGWDQTKMLTGHTAKPDFLKKITWICINHDSRIRFVETVRAFHFGNNFLVEVDVVLPQDMTLAEAHDIGEPLQQKLERLPEVERAFVHLDYNFDHDPRDEHKLV
ncbi:metal tolerance protein 9-like [Mizuhopecten yessoensis]|uniref:metal tolerance protein 9-like n=1 Tax=Mizuhopecten yessoensis TaxID=6573 RepID=UPI000B457598|nr:metal tolerance protein 9-like [Mizuhopecten yessoensis]XP_021366580.1 metal tolerance protein 9-like [Mizuhopecten yessoensis]XP_021366581.1 metal tolerance protein 9-like [Mizuhopecten yessoensis]